MFEEEGVNHFTLEELEELFKDENEQQSPAAEEGTENNETDPQSENNDGNNKVETTKAFAKRLRESTDKARNEEREAIAKQFGFDSYSAMLKSKETEAIKEQGLNPDDVSPLVEKLVEQRLESDPRLKELEGYRKQQLAEFAKKEIAEIKELTNGEVTDISQLSKEVRDLWVKKGSLKAAYLELEGENLIKRVRSQQSKGTTSHLATPEGSPAPSTGKRGLTEQEKKLWRFFNPSMTDEELNKKQVDE
jgi:hypothetical protein